MNKFCVKCGSPIDPTTGTCPKCSKHYTDFETKKVQTKEEKKQAWKTAKQRYKADLSTKKKLIKKSKKDKKATIRAAMSTKQKIIKILVKLLIIIIILALLIIGVFFGLKNWDLLKDSFGGNKTNTQTAPNTEYNGGSIDINNPPTGDRPDEYKIEKPDADKYFAENSTIISTENALNSGRTEAETYKNLHDRGFTQESITTQYDMDGTFFEEKEISESGQNKHPMYVTYYETEDGRLWTIFEINGEVFANPIFYNMENDSGIQLLISETDTLTSYDSTLNKFFVTRPNEDTATVKTVTRINAETLETLTEGEINNL